LPLGCGRLQGLRVLSSRGSVYVKMTLNEVLDLSSRSDDNSAWGQEGSFGEQNGTDKDTLSEEIVATLEWLRQNDPALVEFVSYEPAREGRVVGKASPIARPPAAPNELSLRSSCVRVVLRPSAFPIARLPRLPAASFSTATSTWKQASLSYRPPPSRWPSIRR
jgi:hypothetical protein